MPLNLEFALVNEATIHDVALRDQRSTVDVLQSLETIEATAQAQIIEGVQEYVNRTNVLSDEQQALAVFVDEELHFIASRGPNGDVFILSVRDHLCRMSPEIKFPAGPAAVPEGESLLVTYRGRPPVTRSPGLPPRMPSPRTPRKSVASTMYAKRMSRIIAQARRYEQPQRNSAPLLTPVSSRSPNSGRRHLRTESLPSPHENIDPRFAEDGYEGSLIDEAGVSVSLAPTSGHKKDRNRKSRDEPLVSSRGINTKYANPRSADALWGLHLSSLSIRKQLGSSQLSKCNKWIQTSIEGIFESPEPERSIGDFLSCAISPLYSRPSALELYIDAEAFFVEHNETNLEEEFDDILQIHDNMCVLSHHCKNALHIQIDCIREIYAGLRFFESIHHLLQVTRPRPISPTHSPADVIIPGRHPEKGFLQGVSPRGNFPAEPFSSYPPHKSLTEAKFPPSSPVRGVPGKEPLVRAPRLMSIPEHDRTTLGAFPKARWPHYLLRLPRDQEQPWRTRVWDRFRPWDPQRSPPVVIREKWNAVKKRFRQGKYSRHGELYQIYSSAFIHLVASLRSLLWLLWFALLVRRGPELITLCLTLVISTLIGYRRLTYEAINCISFILLHIWCVMVNRTGSKWRGIHYKSWDALYMKMWSKYPPEHLMVVVGMSIPFLQLVIIGGYLMRLFLIYRIRYMWTRFYVELYPV